MRAAQATPRTRYGARRTRALVALWIAFCCAVVPLFAASPGAAQIAASASVDRERLAPGESLRLTIRIEGAQNVPAPDLGEVSAFQVRYEGPATQISIVDGRVTANVSHNYRLIAREEGKVTLGPFRLALGGRVYETEAIQVTVAGAPSGGGEAHRTAHRTMPWLSVVPAKTVGWMGERIPLSIKLHVGNARIDDLQFPVIGGEGFTLDRLPQPTQETEIVEGRSQQVLRFTTALMPLRSGELTVGPARMGMSVLRSRGRGGFDAFFPDMFAVREPFEARGEPVHILVRPLPEEGKPIDFSGAVGQFDLAVEAAPLDVAAGDPITVRMRISGNGDLSTLDPPRLRLDDRFRVYDPTAVKDDSAPGARVFEQVVIPREAAISELPAVRFSYFDPAAGAYRTTSRGPFPIVVRAPEVTQRPQVLVSREDSIEPVEKLGRDIVYIKDTPGRLHPVGVAFYRSWWFALLQALPPLGFFFLLFSARRRERLASDPRLARFLQAGARARRELERLAKNGENGRFYDDLTSTIHAYLGARLNLPPGAVERDRVLSKLCSNGSGELTRREVGEFFDLVERVRYNPSSDARAERETALALAHAIVRKLERERRSAIRFLTGFVLAALLSAPNASPSQANGGAGVDPHTAFYAANAAYKAGRYDEAISGYESVRGAGLESAALHFNLANARFKKGELGKAVLGYERAARLRPRDPDIRANLSYARELVGDEPGASAGWSQLALPLAQRMTTGELAVLASFLWWCFWAVVALRLIARELHVALTRAALLGGAALLFTFANFLGRLEMAEWTERAVVTAPGEAVVRFEPSARGTEHFTAPEGTTLEVTHVRDGWYQVRRGDGRRGWIPRDVVELVEASSSG